MNAKKIVKAIFSIAFVGGAVYGAYWFGERTNRIKEPYRSMDEFDDSTNDEYNGYDDSDDPDDDFAPDEEYRINEWDKFCCEGYDYRCTNPDMTFTRIRNLDTVEFSTATILRALFAVMENDFVTNSKLSNKMHFNAYEAEKLLCIFEQAGYVSERNINDIRTVYIKDMTLEELL